MPSNRKEMRREEQKKMGLERKGNEKVKTAVSLLIPKTQKFCFLCMPELHKQIFCIWIRRLQSVRPVNIFVVCIISLLKARQLPEHSSCLNYLQNTLFGKISRSKWVNEGLMAKTKMANKFFQHYILLTGVVSWGPILARIPPSIFSLSWRTLEFSYVKYFGIGISMSSYKYIRKKKRGKN